MNEYMNKAIVIGGNHHNALGAIRSLGKNNVEVYLIVTNDKNKSFITKSKYLKKYWIINEDEKKIMDILLNFFSKELYFPVIIPVSDFAESVIDKNLNILKNFFLCPNAGEERNVLKLMDKKYMGELASECGLNVPKNLISGLDDLFENSKNIGYPLIIKPLHSIDGRRQDITICKKSEDLNKIVRSLKKMGYKEVLIQKFIKKEIEIGALGCIFKNTNEVIVPGVIKKIREFPKNSGSCSFGKIDQDIDKFIDVNSLIKFIKKTKFYGIFDIEFLYSKNKSYFIEMNYRNGGNSYSMTGAGVNLVFLWYLDILKRSTDSFEKKIKNKSYFMMDTRDFRHIFKRNINILEWLKCLRKTDTFFVTDTNDLKPIFYKYIYYIGEKLCIC